jgi:membrane-bound ClpP family serine protease
MAEEKRAKSSTSKNEKQEIKSAMNTLPSWPEYIKSATSDQIKKRFCSEVNVIIEAYPDIKQEYCLLFLFNSEGRIGAFDLDQIFDVLPVLNPNREKSILLTILSTGGAIEPAYQISKLCKSFTQKKFIVTIPRQAKSAATLLALGADEIHMGSLGQLGPIDPQLGGLPALGVSQALRTLAQLTEEYPGSSELFARYLRMALTVEQIGYCERISESAVQYATRLIETKSKIAKKAEIIARELVYEYKHHGFVIDSDEAKKHLGSDWIVSASKEIEFAEKIYKLYDLVTLFLNVTASKYIWWVGTSRDGNVFLLDIPKDK